MESVDRRPSRTKQSISVAFGQWFPICLVAFSLCYNLLVPWSLKLGSAIRIGPAYLYPSDIAFLAVLLVRRSVVEMRLFFVAAAGMAAGIFLALVNPEVRNWASSLPVFELYAPMMVTACLRFSASEVLLWRLTITPIYLGIVAEVILFSTGTFAYESLVVSEEVGGLLRIPTTVGAATTTGAVIFLLSMWCLDLWRESSIWRGVIVVAGFIGCGATLSRGPMAMFAASIALWWVVRAFHEGTALGKLQVVVKSVLKVGLLLAGTWLLILVLDLGDAIRLRLERSEQSDELRRARIEEAVEVILEQPLFGVGPGGFLAPPRIEPSVGSPIRYHSPHNSYLLIGAEQGLIGFMVFVGGLILLVATAFHRNPLDATTAALLPLTLIGLNTEVMYVQSNVSYLIAILLAWAVRRPSRLKM